VQVGDGLDIEQQIVLGGHATRSLTRQAAHDLEQPFSYRVQKRSGELGAAADEIVSCSPIGSSATRSLICRVYARRPTFFTPMKPRWMKSGMRRRPRRVEELRVLREATDELVADVVLARGAYRVRAQAQAEHCADELAAQLPTPRRRPRG
jgi:hypothetical protein